MSIRMSKWLGALLPASVLIVACDGGGSNGGGNGAAIEPVTVEDIKSNYVAMAYAAYSDSLSTATDLQMAVDSFIATPTEGTLETARAAYKEARIPYQQSEIMRWDTAITIDNDPSLDGGPASVDEWEGQVNAWPLDENHIISIIEGNEIIATSLLLNQNGVNNQEANVTTGVHAIEFMLWGKDQLGVGTGTGTRTSADFANDGSCADAFCERRATYLKVATDLLVADLEEMSNEWSPTAENTQGTLAYNFLTSNLALDYIWGSIKDMATDELASARMFSALDTGDQEEEHDCFSDLSHVAIYYNFQGVRNAFYGSYGDVSGTGLGDLVRVKDQTTYDELDAAFNSIEAKMKQLLDAGEDANNPIVFDQIILQPASGTERQLLTEAINELIALEQNLHAVRELLSITEITTGGGGDGD